MSDMKHKDWWALAEAAAEAMVKATANAPLARLTRQPYDPSTIARSVAAFTGSLWSKPAEVMELQLQAARQWGEFWGRTFTGIETPKPKDRRFSAEAWQDDPHYRVIRDSYLLAAEQLRALVGKGEGDASTRAMVYFLLDQYLNAIAPTNFPFANPEVVDRTRETGGANLVHGFAHLLEDISSGKGIVRRRTDPGAFEKGKTIAATPGWVVYENDLFQLIQYNPATPTVDAEPLLYVPPLVNRYYMIDLQPRSSLVKWLVDQGRTVFVISWVNPAEELRDKGIDDYVLSGVVEAIDVVRERTGARPNLFAFCLGGTLAIIALAWLAAKGRGADVNSATLIGTMIDFADMRDWAAFVHEAHADALEEHLAQQGFIDSIELQQLFSAMRANDLIWSSVVNHYLLDRAAPPSDLLYWFEDGARIPAAFVASFNRALLLENRLVGGAGFSVGGEAIDLARITTPLLSIALKDDHVSAWDAVYRGAQFLKADFLLGGSGHNAGVINPPSANKHGYWINDSHADVADDWFAGAQRYDGSWWPHWLEWLARHGSDERVAGRAISDGIEPAPGAYVRKP
ncbi:alpha/beta hydrolase [Sphingobium sp. EM0848]|uniref:PHA/PHB synthase family protein n=1 Tax=Sphingobium sp. EM0848 TaxID=2743473 RepID=UPI00159C5BE2|nr:alpha/beta fold hydrolase [Sphingobium sp. EM0848]